MSISVFLYIYFEFYDMNIDTLFCTIIFFQLYLYKELKK